MKKSHLELKDGMTQYLNVENQAQLVRTCAYEEKDDV